MFRYWVLLTLFSRVNEQKMQKTYKMNNVLKTIYTHIIIMPYNVAVDCYKYIPKHHYIG